MKEGMRIFTTGTDCSFSLIITITIEERNSKKSYKHYSAIKKEINGSQTKLNSGKFSEET
jgi:hypothetical protein